MPSHMLVQDNCLYLVHNGEVIPIEDHYRDQITRSGEEILDQMFEKFRAEGRPVVRYTVKDVQDWEAYQAGAHPQTNWRRSSRPASRTVIVGQPRESASPWSWFIGAVILAVLLVWWW